jgi:pantoate--beta-alanine ligase
MGALHNGHKSLITKSKNDGNLVVCSIFVNPTQFNDKEDFNKYPVTTDDDIALLINAHCDVLFLPNEHEIYPHGAVMATAYHFGDLENRLEGAHRPGHFRGVGQVVARLLELVNPDRLYLGQKDFQQCLVIQQLINILQIKTRLVICPTLREEDGLAMSSRNRRLTEPQRALAGIIYQCLISIQSKSELGSFKIVQKECIDLLNRKGFETEYVALANAENLTLLEDYDATTKMVALIAAKIGGVRLIDNLSIN